MRLAVGEVAARDVGVEDVEQGQSGRHDGLAEALLPRRTCRGGSCAGTARRSSTTTPRRRGSPRPGPRGRSAARRGRPSNSPRLDQLDHHRLLALGVGARPLLGVRHPEVVQRRARAAHARLAGHHLLVDLRGERAPATRSSRPGCRSTRPPSAPAAPRARRARAASRPARRRRRRSRRRSPSGTGPPSPRAPAASASANEQLSPRPSSRTSSPTPTLIGRSAPSACDRHGQPAVGERHPDRRPTELHRERQARRGDRSTAARSTGRRRGSSVPR